MRSTIAFRIRSLNMLAAAAVLIASSTHVLHAAGPAQVDVKQSRVYVFVGKAGLGHEHGMVGLVQSGTLQLGAMRDAGSIVFDTGSFEADTPEARAYVKLAGDIDVGTRKQVTNTMLGAGVLDVQQFPTATFKIQSAVAADPRKPGLIKLDGEFTLHGVTKPLQVLAQSETVKGKVRLHGKFTILQSQYGIKPYTKLLGAVGVTDQLTIWGDLWFE
jgi:polyisoprenoid-binding protein YceI